MKRIPYINTVMTPFPWHLEQTASVEHAQLMMKEQGIHHLPVTDTENQVIGVISAEQLAPPCDQQMTLASVMAPVLQVDSHDRLDLVLDQMAAERHDVVVVLHRQHLAGIFTWRDACKQYATLLREPFLPPEGNDAA